MGRIRYLVVWTSGRSVRKKYRFIVQESTRLESVAAGVLDELEGLGGRGRVSLKVSDSVAFWGRVLSSLRTRRSRRKLSTEEIGRREALSEQFQTVLAPLQRSGNVVLVEALRTRRPKEVEWMTELLSPASEPARSASTPHA